MNRPSRDQSVAVFRVADFTITSSPVESRVDRRYRSGEPARFEVNTIPLPLGDQTVVKSDVGPKVRRDRVPLLRSINQMLGAWVVASGISKATFVSSGESCTFT